MFVLYETVIATSAWGRVGGIGRSVDAERLVWEMQPAVIGGSILEVGVQAQGGAAFLQDAHVRADRSRGEVAHYV